MFMKRLIKVEKRRAAPAVQKFAIKKGQRNRQKSMPAARLWCTSSRRLYNSNSGAPIVKKKAKKEEQLALLFKLYAFGITYGLPRQETLRPKP